MAPSLSASQCTSPMQDAAPAAAGAGDQGLGAMHAAAPQQHLAGGGANHTHTAKQPASFWDGVAQVRGVCPERTRRALPSAAAAAGMLCASAVHAHVAQR
jgi:hypothetical protein